VIGQSEGRKGCTYTDIVYPEAHIDFVMAVEFEYSNRGKPTVIYLNFE